MLLVITLFVVVCAYDKLGTQITTIPINITITTNPTIRFKVASLDNLTSAIANIEERCIIQIYK